jgi:hypothetical protein
MRGLIGFVVVLALAAMSTGENREPPEDKRQVLSEHRTVAQLTALEAKTCRGRTALCPDRCGHSGEFADFKIVAYLHYAKLGEYGDPKAERFTVQVADNHGVLKLPKATADAIRGMKPADHLLLDWRHEYVTRPEEGGGSSSFPERPLAKVQPITPAEAEKAIQDAAK